VGGDVFHCLPSGGAAYVLQRVVCAWDDEQAVAILTNCRRAMGQRGTLLLVEQVLAVRDSDARGSTGGRERTEAEYRALIATAGFTLNRVVPTRARFSIIEGIPLKGTH
jgi:hypothetical protein